MKKLLIVLLLVFVSLPTLFAQTDKEKENFRDGDFFLLHNEFPDALPFFLPLVEKYPDNANFNYKVGLCYLNIPGESDKAIPFFEKATNNLTNRYKTKSFSEKKAPYDTYFYLGTAYHINNKIIKAKRAYEKHLSFNHLSDSFDIYFVKKQIEACNNAKKLMQNEVYFDAHNLGQNVNDTYNNYFPGISHDGNTIVFMTSLKFYDAIMLCRKIDGEWTMPVNLSSEVKSDGDLYVCSISADGQRLYMTKNDNLNSDIYVSYLKDNVWSRAELLNMNINTKYWESYASESPDGSTLYFSSSRIDGFGGLDIYKAEKNPLTDDWGKAVNLGPAVNTFLGEDCPYITKNGKRLYFSSQGHENLGGYDIFFAEKSPSDTWTEPVNIGYPINTTDDDIFFTPHNNGAGGYYSIYNNKDGNGGSDIYYLDIFPNKNPRKVKINGVVNAPGFTIEANREIIIDILESATSAKVASPDVEFSSGKFIYQISKPGKYEVVASANGYSKGKTEFTIPSDYSLGEINVKTDLQPIETENPYDNIESPYYTVQIMALYKPVNVSYFTSIDNVKVFYGKDRFYRYISGMLQTFSEANKLRRKIRKMGYRDDIFIRKITREELEMIGGGDKEGSNLM